MLRQELSRGDGGGSGDGGGGVPRTIETGPPPPEFALSSSTAGGYGSTADAATDDSLGRRPNHPQHHHPHDASLGTESFDDDASEDDDDGDDDDDVSELDDETDDEEYSEAGEEAHLIRRRQGRVRRRERLLRICSPLICLWNTTRDAFILVSNVDNAWDSPALQPPIVAGMGGTAGAVGEVPWRHKMGVLFWFLVLAGAYASERSSFKLLVDRAGPFRLFSAEVIVALHAAMLGAWMLMGAIARRKFEIKSLGLPLADVCLMAVLDTVHILLVVVSGSHVSPVLSVILCQFTIPLTVFISKCVHPKGRCRSLCCPPSTCENHSFTEMENGPVDERRTGEDASFSSWGVVTEQHICGAFLIVVAVVLGLLPSVTTLVYPDWFIEEEDILPSRTAWNTVVFALSCIPAAISQLFKEHTLAHHKQPVDSNQLNFLLSAFQFALVAVVSPLMYALQGIGFRDSWLVVYPSAQVSANFYDGLKCFVGIMDDDTAERKYPEPAYCSCLWYVVLTHVLSIMVVGFAVDKIVHAGAAKFMHRGISCGIVLAVIAMYIYEITDDKIEYGPIAHSWHFACATILVVGSEIFHRVSMEEPAFETTYPEIGNLYEEDE